MFERFNPDARAAIARAREEAARAGRREIGTEHLLLGLLAKPGDAAGALASVQANADDLRAGIPSSPKSEPHPDTLPHPETLPFAAGLSDPEALGGPDAGTAAEAGPGSEAAYVEETASVETISVDTASVDTASVDEAIAVAAESRRGGTDGLQVTRNAHRAIDLAVRTAHRFRHEHVSSNHLLLGIIEQPESGAVEALKVAGIRVGTLRTDILAQLTNPVDSERH